MTRIALRYATGLSAALLSFLPTACSDGDKDKAQEVVAPSTEKTPYPEDPDLAHGEKKEAAKPPGADNPAPNESAAIGDLTTDEPPAAPTTPLPDAATAAQPAEPTPPVEGKEAVDGALAANKPSYDAAPSTLPPEEQAAVSGKKGHKHKGKHPAKTAGKESGGSGKTVTLYVSAKLLNVRAKPNAKSAKVRQVPAGTELSVDKHGKWAKIKDGEWVRSKYLSETAEP